MASKAPRLNRQLHRWASLLVAAPLLLVVASGLLLQLKKELPWVQPPTRRGTGAVPAVSFERILDAARSVPQAGVRGWEDVERLDVRPERGLVKVQAKSRWEVQVDLGTGAVLQAAYRRSDWIESLHDGSFFGAWVKRWVFLPSGVLLLALLATGLYLFVLPYLARRR